MVRTTSSTVLWPFQAVPLGLCLWGFYFRSSDRADAGDASQEHEG